MSWLLAGSVLAEMPAETMLRSNFGFALERQQFALDSYYRYYDVLMFMHFHAALEPINIIVVLLFLISAALRTGQA